MEEKGIRAVLYQDGDAVAVRGSYGFAEKGILLDCPLDTTPAGDLSKWSFPPYEGVIATSKNLSRLKPEDTPDVRPGSFSKGTRMYGRGTADSKAGIVSMLYAVLALKKFAPEEDVRVELVFDGGEQNGGVFGYEAGTFKGAFCRLWHCGLCR